MGDPTITRHDDGTLTVGWPDPPLRTYEVAHEALRFPLDDYNDVVERVATLEANAVDLRRAWREDSEGQHATNVRLAAERDEANARVATLEGGMAQILRVVGLAVAKGQMGDAAQLQRVAQIADALLDASHDQGPCPECELLGYRSCDCLASHDQEQTDE